MFFKEFHVANFNISGIRSHIEISGGAMKKFLVLNVIMFNLLAFNFGNSDEYKYNCRWQSGSQDIWSEHKLAVDGEKAVATSEEWGKLAGKEDPDYNPTHNVGLLRYPASYDPEPGEGYDAWMLIDKDFKTGGDEGTLKIESRGEGFFSEVYYCVEEGVTPKYCYTADEVRNCRKAAIKAAEEKGKQDLGAQHVWVAGNYEVAPGIFTAFVSKQDQSSEGNRYKAITKLSRDRQSCSVTKIKLIPRRGG
jgi:hypothetical protein